jgi:hypothetical protein
MIWQPASKPILKHILDDPKAFIEEVRLVCCVLLVKCYKHDQHLSQTM